MLSQLHSYATGQLPEIPELRSRVGMIQQFFTQHIVPLAPVDVESPEIARLLSYHTEMNKQMRLLEMDAMFLAGARQAATAQARVNAMAQRVQTLRQYCEAVLEKDEG